MKKRSTLARVSVDSWERKEKRLGAARHGQCGVGKRNEMESWCVGGLDLMCVLGVHHYHHRRQLVVLHQWKWEENRSIGQCTGRNFMRGGRVRSSDGNVTKIRAYK